jgi:hypothetical protein
LDSDDADRKTLRSAPFNFREPYMTRNSRIAAALFTAAIATLFSVQYIGSGRHAAAGFPESADSAAPVEASAPGFTAGESNDAASPLPTAP